MKNFFLVFSVISLMFFSSCSDESKIKSSIETYLDETLKDPRSLDFTSIKIIQMDSITAYTPEPEYDEYMGKVADKVCWFTKNNEKYNIYIYKGDTIPQYMCEYKYKIKNSVGDIVNVTFSCAVDDNFNLINKSLSKNINGDYASVTGNVYWLYNNYVGNKPDAGSKIAIYSADTSIAIQSTTADVLGNYKFDKLTAGKYYVVIQSGRTNNRPSDHLTSFRYSGILSGSFNYDIEKVLAKELNEYDIASNKTSNIIQTDVKQYGGYYKWREKVDAAKDAEDAICEKIIDKLPDDIKSALGLGTGYSRFLRVIVYNSIEINPVFLDENENEHIITDFGITYF